jgi:hypothetical protein
MTIDGQELPGAGHATQFDDAAVPKPVPERATRSRGAGDEDFAGRCLAENPRCDVHCDSSDVGIQRFALAGVDARADLNA